MGVGIGWASLAAGVLLAGCGGPFGPCFQERIEVGLSGSVNVGGTTVRVASTDAVGPSNFEDFDLVRRMVIDGESLPRELIWTATIFGEPSGVVSVFMPGDARIGQALSLRAIDGGGWGAPPGSRTDAQVHFSFGGFHAASVQGTLTVEVAEPMRVRLRFTAVDAAAVTRVADLTAVFSYDRFRTACT